MFEYSRVARSSGLLVAAMLSMSSHAATFCVNNSADFATASLTAESNGEADDIDMVAGSYSLSGNFNYRSDEDLNISGGWNANCTTRTENALNTVLDGGNSKFFFIETKGTLNIDGIHFDRIPIVELSISTLNLRHNIFTGIQGTDSVTLESSDSTVLVDSNVFDAKNVELTNKDGTDSNQITWHVFNNTFLNASVGQSDEIARNGYGLSLSDAGFGSNLHIVLANNALWNNATGGIHLNSAPEILATHNNWQSFTYVQSVTLANGSTGNSTADPQIDGTYHPIAPNGASVNSGTSNFPGGIGATDVGGGPRVVGTAPDRGAYESPVNDSLILTVTNTADSGDGSLRAALTAAASSPKAQQIVFALSGCPKTINVNSALPAIVDTLTIDGYTQNGSQANTLAAGSNAYLCVVLNGNYASSEGLVANNLLSHVTVRGLAFEGFGFAAIDFTDGDTHVIQGNQFGGPLSVLRSRSMALSPNARGIRLASESADSFVGGIDPQQRNVIDGSTVYGVALSDDLGGHEMRNNYVGLTPSGSAAAGNAVGVIVSSANNLLDRNYIGDSTAEGVRLQGNPTFQGYPQANVLTGNVIGLPAVQGTDSLQNFGAGVRITASAIGNMIGVDTNGQISANTIVGNGLYGSSQDFDGYGGISVESGTGNRISGNIIYANYGLAIDLGNDGPTANDATDSDTGANLLQNFPTITSVRHDNDVRTLSGSIYLKSATRIEAFASTQCASSGRVDAAIVLSTNSAPLAPPGLAGSRTFSIPIGRGPGNGVDAFCRLGATATDVNGNTSEISTCFVDDTIFAHSFDATSGFRCGP